MSTIVLRRPYSCIAVLVLLIMGVHAVVRAHSPGFDETYLHAASLLTHHGDIYKDLPADTYPPFSTWFFVPLSHLSARMARAIWFTASAVSLVYVIASSWRLSGGTILEPLPPWPPRREHLAFLAGNVVALQFALNAITHLQTDLLIGAFIMLGCTALARNAFARGAVWLGIAAAFKATPLLFAPYLVCLRRSRAAILIILIAIGANLLPNMYPPPGGGVWLARWYQLFLQPMTRADYVPGNWRNVLNNNQALAGAANRWVLSSWLDDPDSKTPAPQQPWSPQFLVSRVARQHPGWNAGQIQAESARQTVRATFVALCLMSGLPVAWCLLTHWRRAAALRERAELRVLEYGMVMCLMLLLSPNSSRAHFCILFLPAFCISRRAMAPGASAALRTLLAVAAICSTASIHLRLPFTFRAEQFLLWLGMVTWATFFLLLACCVAWHQSLRTPLETIPVRLPSGSP